MALLLVLFIIVPLVELAVIVQVADAVGIADTIAVLLVVSIAGAWLVKREGWAAWARVNEQLVQGRLPGREVVDGLMILIAGALLLTPGFVTDAVGLLLLLPPVRALLRRVATKGLERRMVVVSGGVIDPRSFRTPGPPSPRGTHRATEDDAEIIDAEIIDVEIIDAEVVIDPRADGPS